MNYDMLTLTFEIKDKEKFREFHARVFPSKTAEEINVINEIGARVIISSWSNPHDEIDNLNRAIRYALERLDEDDSYFCEGISNGKTIEEMEVEDDTKRK